MTESAAAPLALPPPPATEQALVAWVRLARSHRVGPATFLRLLAEHGEAEAALDALPAVAAAAGVAAYRAASREEAERELANGRRAGGRPLVLGAPGYPALLARIPDPPPMLWALGAGLADDRARVGLVGARNASALGLRMAGHLARSLGALGFATVSGLARGIDTSAHRASLETGTVAVLAGGIDAIYPPENAALAAALAETGWLLSEMPPGLEPQARHFPRRNRILSGLCPGIVVIEGAAKSGSLITARTALEQGREVMAVPGHPFDARAAGCLMLLRDGATLVRSAADVAEALGSPAPKATSAERAPAPSAPRPAPEPGAPDLAGRVLALLGPSPVSEDALARTLGRPAAEVLSALAELDLSGALDRHPGGLVSRAAAAG